ncbi:NlpC/P60 family protein, partial [Oscillospiraceae bacterium OttesenSCG-928-F05]|nr:NlpC/P60 family protein [Oscillospiraceae bacterium OttesenSCG-928-F05]
AKEAAQKATGFVRRHWKGLLALLGIGLMIMFLVGGLQSCSSMFGGASSSIIASSYLSEDADMLAAEAAYSALEAALQSRMDNIESVYPGYDEYRLDLDEIGHDPYVLISILSALHDGVFTIDEVQGDLAMLFDKQYILTVTETVEVRYRTETDTWTDDEGNTHTDTYEVAYNYYILNVELENFNLSHVPVYIMSEETLGLYATYMSTLGNRPDLFPTGSYPYASTLKEPIYYDIPAEALEDEIFATLIAEAEKYIGYPYVWGGSSPATSFDCSGFVSYVLTNSGLCNTGRLGAQSLYNISTPVTAANARPGDLVFFVGTYDTPGISHVGIYVGNGVMLHCGDPISYTSIETSYWQSHFYAFGRPPY